MTSHPKKITSTVEIETVDIPTMTQLSDAEYRKFVQEDGLVFVDHHDVLRSSAAGYPLATTLEQIDILVEELQKLRSKMVPR